MWQVIYDKLKEKGLNPYAPGQHTGICNTKYVVVKEQTQAPFFNNNKVGYRLVDLILFVPVASYVQVEPYAKLIKAAMKELPQLRYTGNETPVIVDDEKQAYTTSIEYQILKRL
jgi:hypothetical protein